MFIQSLLCFFYLFVKCSPDTEFYKKIDCTQEEIYNFVLENEKNQNVGNTETLFQICELLESSPLKEIKLVDKKEGENEKISVKEEVNGQTPENKLETAVASLNFTLEPFNLKFKKKFVSESGGMSIVEGINRYEYKSKVKFEVGKTKILKRQIYKSKKDYCNVYISNPHVYSGYCKEKEEHQFKNSMYLKDLYIFQCMFYMFFKQPSDFVHELLFWEDYSTCHTESSNNWHSNRPLGVLKELNNLNSLVRYIQRRNVHLGCSIVTIFEGLGKIVDKFFSDEIDNEFLILDLFQDLANLMSFSKDKKHKFKTFIFGDQIFKNDEKKHLFSKEKKELNMISIYYILCKEINCIYKSF